MSTIQQVNSLSKVTDILTVLLQSYKIQHEIVALWKTAGDNAADPVWTITNNISNRSGRLGRLPAREALFRFRIALDALTAPAASSLLSIAATSSLRGSTVGDIYTGNNFRRGSMAEGLMFTRKSLYRRASFSANDNELAAAEAARVIKRFRVNLDPLESESTALSSFSGELATAIVKTDIAVVGEILMFLHMKRSSDSSSLRESKDIGEQLLSNNPLAPNTRRDVYGDLIITQTEMLFHVWLPLFADPRTNADQCTLALAQYIGLLTQLPQPLPVPIHPQSAQYQHSKVAVCEGLYLLLMTVLFSKRDFKELSNLLHSGFIPGDNPTVDIAMEALKMSEIILDRISRATSLQHSTSNAAELENCRLDPNRPPLQLNRYRRISNQESCEFEAAVTLQKCGEDMMLRLGLTLQLVRWFLARGSVLDAIRLCSRSSVNQPILPQQQSNATGVGGIGEGGELGYICMIFMYVQSESGCLQSLQTSFLAKNSSARPSKLPSNWTGRSFLTIQYCLPLKRSR